MKNFIEDIIENDINDKIVTRFPPEPNAPSLHLGHVKSIHLNFEIAKKYGGTCNLRFDDTNPSTESKEYIESMKRDLKWLGYEPDETRHASDYFKYFIECAKHLILNDKAYVCELTSEEIRENMGTTDKPGTPSPYRNRDSHESYELFKKMCSGKIPEGKMTLRAKIDMSSSNVHMRDPIIYRIKHMEHHTAGMNYIYPMYDFAHPISDFLEGITHSLCTLEFEVHRPLYEWVIENCKEALVSYMSIDVIPRQIEFSRLNLSYTIMSKRKLKTLIENNIVEGFDDPRLPTISGMRKRGIPAEALRNFCEKIGVTRRESVVNFSLLESCTRDVLNKTSNRRMVVFNPLKVTITNWEGGEELLPADLNPENKESGVRYVNFGKNLFIEKEDFMENAPSKFYRLSKGKEVRFKYGYYVTCNEVIKDENGEVIELLCTYDPNTKGGWSDDGRKIKGTNHWVNAVNYNSNKVNLYDRLFNIEEPTDNFINEINDNSKIVVNAIMEMSTLSESEKNLQFERNGYYVNESEGVWNRTVSLKESWN